MSHTPGPWRRSGDNIIQTNHITRDVWTIPHEDGDLDLIAAAPDLLAVCHMFRRYVSCHKCDVGDISEEHKAECFVSHVDAAIAKATTPPPAPPLPSSDSNQR